MQTRIGTTTAAIGLTNWLAHAGVSVCYIEANTSGCLNYMGRAFEMKEQDEYFAFGGLPVRFWDPPVHAIAPLKIQFMQ